MFIPTIIGQGSEAQKAALLPKSNSLEIIGTYAQTELGHGTYVRGLETTATFDKAGQQFVIHSPTQTATKWWPGGLGKTATHAVVMARLFIDACDYGPHAFVVQLWSLETHKCLAVTIGDIGPKFGYNGVDNGFMRFDHVVVPHDAMLSKFAQVRRIATPPPRRLCASVAKPTCRHGVGEPRREVQPTPKREPEGNVQHDAVCARRHRGTRRPLPRQVCDHCHSLLLCAPPNSTSPWCCRAAGAVPASSVAGELLLTGLVLPHDGCLQAMNSDSTGCTLLPSWLYVICAGILAVMSH